MSLVIFRHIALRQDHYEVAVLLLMRGANLKIKNKNDQEPAEVIPPKKDMRCRTIVKLSTLLQGLMKDTKQHSYERVLTNDITNGKETNPIQCVNDLDDENLPTNYTYISRCCVTTNVPIDRNISTLQVSKPLTVGI
jgi:euchromatic histone-lysine N-methyltransferase